MGSRAISAPQIRIVPRVAGMIPARQRSVVVFPAPFGPTNPSTCPDSTVNESSFTATNSPYSLVRASTSIIDAATDGAQTSGNDSRPPKSSKAQRIARPPPKRDEADARLERLAMRGDPFKSNSDEVWHLQRDFPGLVDRRHHS